MFCLNAVDVKCPICGTINKSLDFRRNRRMDGMRKLRRSNPADKVRENKKRLPIRRIVCARNLGRDRIGINLVTGKAA